MCSEQPNEMWIGHRDRPNESLIRDPALVSDQARRFINYPGGHNEGFPDTFKQCFRAFYDYIRAGDFSSSATFPTFADGHREILLCEAILESHRRGKWVSVKGGRS
jgi:predicted dehydrogenase